MWKKKNVSSFLTSLRSLVWFFVVVVVHSFWGIHFTFVFFFFFFNRQHVHKGHRVNCQWSKQLQTSYQSHRSQKNLLQILEMYFLIKLSLQEASVLLSSSFIHITAVFPPVALSTISHPQPMPILQNPTQAHVHLLNHLWLLHFSDKNSSMAFHLSQDQFQPTQHGSNSCAGPAPRPPPQLFLLSPTWPPPSGLTELLTIPLVHQVPCLHTCSFPNSHLFILNFSAQNLSNPYSLCFWCLPWHIEYHICTMRKVLS